MREGQIGIMTYGINIAQAIVSIARFQLCERGLRLPPAFQLQRSRRRDRPATGLLE
jgi:hypothetical protein